MGSDYIEGIAERYEESAFQMAVFLAAEKSESRLREETEEERTKSPSELAVKRLERMLVQKVRKNNLKQFGKTAWKIGSRIAIAIMIIITVGLTTVMSVDALRSRFTEFLLTFHSEYTELELHETTNTGTAVEGGQILRITGSYMPAYTPEGFSLKSMMLDEQANDLEYENDEGMFISFSGYTRDALSNIDTENADSLEIVDVNGRSGLLVMKEGVYTLAWSRDDYYFILTSNVSRDETLRIAQSVSLEE